MLNHDLSCTVTHYQVFVKSPQCLVIPDEQADFETISNIEAAGFELVWDSAPSEFTGVKYAADNFNAFLPVAKRES